MKFYATLISLPLLVAACAPAAEQRVAEALTQAEDVAAIKALAPIARAAFNTGDAAALADLFADDAILMPANQPALIGKEAIQSWIQTIFDQFTFKWTASSEEVEVAGDWAFERSTSTFTVTPKAGGEPIFEDNSKGLTIYKRQPDGSWKIFRGISNSNNPLPGAGE